jgi:hypothetical protein
MVSFACGVLTPVTPNPRIKCDFSKWFRLAATVLASHQHFMFGPFVMSVVEYGSNAANMSLLLGATFALTLLTSLSKPKN